MDVPYLSSSPPPLVEQDLNDDDDDNVLVAQEEDEEFAPVSDLLPDLDEGFEPIALSVPVSTSDKCDDAEKKAAESFAAGSDQRSEESGKITGSPPRSVVGVPVVCEEGHDVDERHGHQESEVEAGISSIKGNEDEVGKVNTGLDQVQPDVDVPDDDFGDFASNALSEAVKTESDEVEKSVSSAAISDTQNGDVSEDAAPVAQETDPGWGTDPSWGADPDWATDPDWSSGQKGDGDDFGDFGEFASSNSFTSDLATDDVSDVQKAPSLASVFRQLFKAEPHPVDGQSVSNVSLSDANDLQLIAQLSDMDRSSGLSLSWANCKTRSSLLGVLNIDPTNILFDGRFNGGVKETFLLPERMNEKSFFSPRFLGDFYQEPARVEQDVRDDKGSAVSAAAALATSRPDTSTSDTIESSLSRSQHIIASLPCLDFLKSPVLDITTC